jgi:hypothetical protein
MYYSTAKGQCQVEVFHKMVPGQKQYQIKVVCYYYELEPKHQTTHHLLPGPEMIWN